MLRTIRRRSGASQSVETDRRHRPGHVGCKVASAYSEELSDSSAFFSRSVYQPIVRHRESCEPLARSVIGVIRVAAFDESSQAMIDVISLPPVEPREMPICRAHRVATQGEGMRAVDVVRNADFFVHLARGDEVELEMHKPRSFATAGAASRDPDENRLSRPPFRATPAVNFAIIRPKAKTGFLPIGSERA